MSEPRTDTCTCTYPYPVSPTGLYVLKLDGAEVSRGTEQDVWKWLHDNTSCSVDRALRYEGYSVEVAP